MNYSMQQIGALLKQERIVKGLSQRALAQKVGIPQSHISKIENGLVDLQASSLIELARSLELELMLVPTILVRTVDALKAARDNKDYKARPMYQLSKDEDEE